MLGGNCITILSQLIMLTLFRTMGGRGGWEGGVGVAKKPPYQFFPCNF